MKKKLSWRINYGNVRNSKLDNVINNGNDHDIYERCVNE